MPAKYWDSITFDPQSRQIRCKRSSEMRSSTLVLAIALALIGYVLLDLTGFQGAWGLCLGLFPLSMLFVNKGGKPMISKEDGQLHFHENFGEFGCSSGGEFKCLVTNSHGDSYETEIRYVYPSGTYLFFQSDEYVSETAFQKLFAHLGEKLSWEIKKIS